MCTRIPCPIALCALLAIFCAEAVETHVRYAVIGAGPGGLQIAHYLDSAGRDYVVFEKSAVPGSFFQQLPRFRQLISINKRYSGRVELDHLMRHDWNSLLSDPSHSAARSAWPASSTNATLTLDTAQAAGWRLFRNYSSAYYPHADDLVRYLGDWSAGSGPAAHADASGADALQPTGPGHPARPLRVRYNTAVVGIEELAAGRQSGGRPLHPRYRLTLAGGDTVTCTFLILATGLSVRSGEEGQASRPGGSLLFVAR